MTKFEKYMEMLMESPQAENKILQVYNEFCKEKDVFVADSSTLDQFCDYIQDYIKSVIHMKS